MGADVAPTENDIPICACRKSLQHVKIQVIQCKSPKFLRAKQSCARDDQLIHGCLTKSNTSGACHK